MDYVLEYKLGLPTPYYVERLELHEESGHLVPVLTCRKSNARRFGAVDGMLVAQGMKQDLGCELELVE